MEGESGTVVIRLCAAALHCRSQGDGPRVARFVCPATHRRIIENGECSFGLSCGKRKQRPLAVPCIRFGPWAGLALHESFAMRYGECSFGLSCGKRKQRPLAVPCIRFGPWAGLALHESFAMRYGECSFGLSCGKRKQRPLAVPCIRFGPWAGLASCRPLRQKFLPVSAAGSGRNFSPSRRPVPRRGR